MRISAKYSPDKRNDSDTSLVNSEISGVLTYFKKNRSSGENAITLGLIKGSFECAIEYTGILKGTRGVMMFLGIFGGTAGVWMGFTGAAEIIKIGINGPLSGIFFLLTICIIISSVFIALKSVRYEVFRPIDEPILFDRKHRKVYRIYREVYAGWRGLLMPWPMKFAEQ